MRKFMNILRSGTMQRFHCGQKKCHEIAVQMCIVLSEPIGGLGVVVEIDESMFGKSKIPQHTFIFSLKK